MAAAFYTGGQDYSAPRRRREPKMAVLLGTFATLWIAAGLAGLVYSILCAGRPGKLSDQIMGLVIATLYGPLFWVFVVANKNYCR